MVHRHGCYQHAAGMSVGAAVHSVVVEAIINYISVHSGSLGFPHVCLQEECPPGGHEEERQTLQCRPSEVAL